MTSRPAPDDRIPRLTRVAVERVAAVAGRVDVPVLQGLLYRSGSVALGPRNVRVWDPASIGRAIARAAADFPCLATEYTSHSSAHWHSWNRISSSAPGSRPPRHKVYLSPQPEHLLEALPTLFETVTYFGIPGFKIGASTEGVLRPDKIVLYLPDAAAADTVAQRLADELTELAPQGVPFSGQVGDTGIASRGRDPEGTSWRAWLIDEVAQALDSAAQQDGSPAVRALDKLASRGIDTLTWWPTWWPDDQVSELAA